LISGGKMRKKLTVIEKPSLTLHLEYSHITLGELGNILIRFQAALRSLAGLSPGEYDGRFSNVQPHFITSSVSSKHSIDVTLLLAILSTARQAPSLINECSNFTAEVFRRFKIAVMAMVQGKIEVPKSQDNQESTEFGEVDKEGEGAFKVEVTKGKIEMSRAFLDELTPTQRRKLFNFLWSITGPTSRVDIGNEESQLSLDWSEGEDTKGLD